ncbi:MAG TPA: GTPase ObgE [Bacteroidota bacterium]|nr:GTPase ObgE [Bacteroidota bacterium]
MFIDQATIEVRAGHGGNGIVSFRREKFIPKGGPDGGNGGNGGSIILRADRHLTTLLDFRYRRNYQAPAGEHGFGARRTGKSGEDIILKVPVGTLVKDAGSGAPIADLVRDGQEVMIAHGGRGGKGNAMFATSTNQAPRKATPGGEGEDKKIVLELRLIADAGLVGFPNAGKSTLISRISAAKPKIADYPFTTLVPNLGIVRYAEYQSFVVADLPGLVEGAHHGKGLGLKFLRHIERTRVLVFLIDCTTPDMKREYRTLRKELSLYNSAMLKKPHIIAVTKADLADGAGIRRDAAKAFPKRVPVAVISSVTGSGIQELLDLLWKTINRKKS